jgi:hypothetical protein
MEFPPLPQLVGSEKQIQWATSLRAAVVAEMRSHRADVEQWAADHARDATTFAPVEREAMLFTLILTHTEATWWIDRQELSLLELTRGEAAALEELAQRERHGESVPTEAAPVPRKEGYKRPPKGHSTH